MANKVKPVKKIASDFAPSLLVPDKTVANGSEGRSLVDDMVGQRLSDTAFRQIAGMIFEGRFLPGERLPAERELSTMLNISRSTLRDALNRLEARGLVDRRIGSGNYVCTLIPDSLRSNLEEGLRDRHAMRAQIIDVRKPLEIWAAAQAAEKRSAEQLNELKNALDVMLGNDREGNLVADDVYIQADIKFHITIAQMTGNTVYVHLQQFLSDCVWKSIEFIHPSMDNDYLSRNNFRHEAIFRAIQARDPEASRQAMIHHFELGDRLMATHS